MKTSNKLLIILLISIPLMMFAFNWLLVREYRAGNLTLKFENPTEVKRELPAFRHVVMDGRLHSGGSVESKEQLSMNILTGAVPKPVMKIPQVINDLVQTRVSNDTLYISYFKENVDPQAQFFTPLYFYRPELIVPEINSLALSYGNYLITHLDTDSLWLSGNASVIYVNNLDTKKMYAKATGVSTISIGNNNKVGELEYDIIDKDGKLELGHDAVRLFKPGHLHPEAQIVLIGTAPEMQKFIGQLSRE